MIKDCIINPFLKSLGMTIFFFFLSGFAIQAIFWGILANLDVILTCTAIILGIVSITTLIVKTTYLKKHVREKITKSFILYLIASSFLTLAYFGWGIQIFTIGRGAAQLFGFFDRATSAVIFDVSTILVIFNSAYLMNKVIKLVYKISSLEEKLNEQESNAKVD